MILSETVEVKPTGKMIQYYKDKGYDVKYRESIMVKIEDLSKGSKARVDVLCDMCKQNKMSVAYENYVNVVERSGSYVCKECAPKKKTNTMLLRYGVEHYAQTEEFHKDMMRRMQQLYGVDHYSQTLEYKNKYCNTCLDKYGYSNPNQSPEVREKVNKTLCENGTQKTSKQQLYLHKLFCGKINFPISYYAIDICFPEEKIALEYDGGFHDGRVKLGILTQEEFDQKEIMRNNIIKREGYKQIRIISRHDKLPSDQTLLQMLSQAKQYFSKTNHSWTTYDIDNSIMLNAENKDTNGVFFDYGELRKITEQDLEFLESQDSPLLSPTA